jgi:triacylglycerol lipase
MRKLLVAVIVMGLSWASPALAASGRRNADRRGSWSSSGRYTSSPATQRFRKLHGKKGYPIPRYPIVLVHGLFGFDELRKGPFYGNYFVGVARYLRSQGMQVLVPETTPFAGLQERGEELNAQILASGWEKFHIIAHSAGGLDARYAISKLGLADKVVSLTTVSTPHHGTWYADFALKWVLERQRAWKIWDFFKLRRQGIYDISVAGMKKFNAEVPNAPGVRYFSFGGSQPAYKIVPPLSSSRVVISIMEKAAVGKAPSFKERFLSRGLVPRKLRKLLKREPRRVARSLVGETPNWVIPELAGKNDGLVSVSSARWGEFQVDLVYDHLDQMGWFTRFNVKRFYRNITRMLADAGL